MALQEIITKTVVKAIDEASQTKKTGAAKTAVVKEVAKEAVEKMMENPAVVNATNQEPLVQSRVANGSVVGFIGGLGVLIPIIAQQFGYDITPARVLEIGFAVAAVAGPAYAFLGRALEWSAPMWSSFFKKKREVNE